MKVSVITDEVSADLETALELSATWGVNAIELRSVEDQRWPDVSDYWKVRVPQLIQESRLTVAALSPGLFFIPFPSKPAPIVGLRFIDARQLRAEEQAKVLLDRHVNELLPASIESAKQLGVRTIICFSFSRPAPHLPPPPPPDEVIQVFRYASGKVHEAGMTLAIEVDHFAFGDISSRAADIVRRVDHPALGINWDLGNAYAAGEDVPYPDGYAHVHGLVRHVHFKDAKMDPLTGKRSWTLDDGVIDWRGQIAALARDGYDGYISVEHHMRPRVEATRRTLERIRRHIREAADTANQLSPAGVAAIAS
jgi:sugar phosphate isomerase/epimerase